jgi:hypothetical protein
MEECTYFWGVNTSWGINMVESKRPLNREDNQAPQPTRITLDLMLTSVSPKARGREKYFFVKVLMIGSALGAYSNCLAVAREEPSPNSTYFRFGALDECLVVFFLEGILPTSIR